MTIFNQAMKRIFKNKLRLLVLIIMPVLFIMMFAMQEERYLTMGVVDKDSSNLSRGLIEDLSQMDKVKIIILDEKEVYDKTVSYQVDYTIIIEEGFEDKLVNGETPTINEFYLNEKEKLFYARNSVENYIYNVRLMAAGSGFDKVKFEEALLEYQNSKLTLENDSVDVGKLPQTRFAAGFLVQFMLYMSVITAGLILEDKSSGIFYRIFYAPITLKKYILENLTAFLTVGIMQVTIIMILMKLVFSMDFGGGAISFYLLFVVFSMVCIALGMWLVSLFKKPMGAYASIILLTTPLVMLGGCYWPKDFMPQIFQRIALFIPTTWVMDGVDKILYQGSGIGGILLEITILIIFGAIFLSAGLFKKVDISK